jgi:hypothetical protein
MSHLSEAPSTHPEHQEIHPEIVDVPEGSYAEIPLNGEPITTQVASNGDTHEILAWIKLPAAKADESTPETDNSTHIAIVKPQSKNDDKLMLLSFRDNTLVETSEIPINNKRQVRGHYPQGSKTGFLAAPVKRHGKTSLFVDFSTNEDIDTPAIAAAPETVKVGNGNVTEAVSSITKHEKRVKRFQKIGAILGTYTVLASGGVVDHVGEATNDAAVVVEHNFSSHQPNKSPGMLPTWMRNISGFDMSGNTAVDQEDAAVHETSDVMKALDSHETDSIYQQARAFEEKYRDKILTEKQISDYKERLDNATTPEEAVVVLDSFMQFYGKRALLYDGKGDGNHKVYSEAQPFDPAKHTVDDVRATSNDIIDAFGPLPSFIVGDGKFKNIVLSSGAQRRGLSKGTSIGGEVDGDGLILPIQSKTQRALDTATNVLPDATGGYDTPTHLILHELGHTYDETKNTEASMEKSGGSMFSKIGSFVFQKVLNINTEPSMYAAISEEREGNAEDFAYAFNTSDQGGLAHPDEWRRFNSGANQRALGVLIAVDARYPGLSSFIAAKRLAKRSVVRTPIVPFINTP